MTETKLEKLKRREAQIKEQIKQEEAKYRAKERKARTKRLIENGAVMEKFFNTEFLTTEDRELIMRIMTENHTRKDNNTSWTYADLIMKEFKRRKQQEQELNRAEN